MVFLFEGVKNNVLCCVFTLVFNVDVSTMSQDEVIHVRRRALKGLHTK